ncbi:hypothetical protein CHCC20335_1034 [Bacillus paralicheniformis]|nr:hypothetical protein CHCC20335_1034 [Bacillus paralicheniformis]
MTKKMAFIALEPAFLQSLGERGFRSQYRSLLTSAVFFISFSAYPAETFFLG